LPNARICALALLVAASACGDDGDSDPLQNIVYTEHDPGTTAYRLVQVADDGRHRIVLWQGSGAEEVTFVTPSPTGETILFATYVPPADIDAPILFDWHTVPVGGGTVSDFAMPAFADDPVWAPDGASVVWNVSGRLGVALPGSAAVVLVTPDSLYALHPSWSPDGSHLLFPATKPEDGAAPLYTVSRTGDELRLISAAPLHSDARAEWSPVGDQIAFLRENSEVWVSAPDGSNPRRVATGEFAPSLFWSPDGLELMLRASDGMTRLVVATGALLPTHAYGPDGFVTSPWSPDGVRLSTNRSSATETRVYIANLDGSRAKAVSPAAVNGRNGVWVPPAD
jgi:hypothetical protein